MSDYTIYPAVDANYNFPLVVREALINSPEAINKNAEVVANNVADPESELRQKLDYLYASNVIPMNAIDGGTP